MNSCWQLQATYALSGLDRVWPNEEADRRLVVEIWRLSERFAQVSESYISSSFLVSCQFH